MKLISNKDKRLILTRYFHKTRIINILQPVEKFANIVINLKKLLINNKNFL